MFPCSCGRCPIVHVLTKAKHRELHDDCGQLSAPRPYAFRMTGLPNFGPQYPETGFLTSTARWGGGAETPTLWRAEMVIILLALS